MALQDILIHMDNTPQCTTRLDVAVDLAKRHGARLTGLYVLTSTAYASRNIAANTQTEAAEAQFRDRTVTAAIPADWQRVDWRVVGVTVGEIITRYDLLQRPGGWSARTRRAQRTGWQRTVFRNGSYSVLVGR